MKGYRGNKWAYKFRGGECFFLHMRWGRISILKVLCPKFQLVWQSQAFQLSMGSKLCWPERHFFLSPFPLSKDRSVILNGTELS